MSAPPRFTTSADRVPGDGREVEWQLAATDLAPIDRWLREHGTVNGLELEPCSTEEIRDVYLDTADWRLHRAGFALRLRSASGRSEATLKALHSASTEMADRRELSEVIGSRAQSYPEHEDQAIRHLHGPVGSRVLAVSGPRTLVPLFVVRTSRQRFAVREAHQARPLGEIALDDTVIWRPDGAPGSSLKRVEVEALTEEHEPLRSLVKTLRDDCALTAAAESKYSQGLKSVGLTPWSAPAGAAVDASMTLAQIALSNLRRHWSAWELHEPAARLGDEPEALHDWRLAARRLDAGLRLFRECVPPALLEIRPTLKAVLRVLGEVRDLDVALGDLEGFCRGLAKSDRDALTPLREHLAQERGRARMRMLRALDSVAVQKRFPAWAALLAAPPIELPPAAAERAVPAVEAAGALLKRRYRKVRKAADALRTGSPPEAFHALRGRVKQLRYALEAVALLYGKPAERLLRALRRWQDILGSQHDAVVAVSRLHALAGATPGELPAQSWFLMGRLAEHQTEVARRAAKLHPKGYRQVKSRYRRLRMKLDAMVDRPARDRA